MTIGNYVLPCLIALILLHGFLKHIPLFDCFVTGAKKGLQSAVAILPSLVGLIVAIRMFQLSGALDVLLSALRPVAQLLRIPEEVLPLALLRPVSGGGSLALFEGVLQEWGPDSPVGRIASTMMGSSETTFYAISVYFGSVGIRKTKQTIPAALLCDLLVCLTSAYLILYGGL